MAGDTTAMGPTEADGGGLDSLLAPLKEDPARSAVLMDVDGTIAPITLKPGDAAVPEHTRDLLRALVVRYALVGCMSGRRALDARRVVGLDELAYSGNHGFELLLPGDEQVRPDPSLDGHEGDASEFRGGARPLRTRAGRDQDRGQGSDRRPALARRRERGSGGIARPRDRQRGRVAGPDPASRPQGAGDPAQTCRSTRGSPWPPCSRRETSMPPSTAATIAPTSMPSRACATLREDGRLSAIACIAVASDESPPEVSSEADLTVDGPEGFVRVLEELGE